MLNSSGAQHFPTVLSSEQIASLRTIADVPESNQPGTRLQGNAAVQQLANAQGVIGQVCVRLLGTANRPVRAVMFDKSPNNNWIVPWHQDRTIAVRERRDVPGYGPWSRKAGVWHVEPPFEITARMLTLRVHLDDCGIENAPLLYVPGSHLVGKLPSRRVADFAREQGHAVSPAKAGDVWAYATAIVHSSQPAQKPCRRRVLQIDYSADELSAGLEWAGI